MAPLLWIRHEVKPGEHRTPITPDDCKTLVQLGVIFWVVRCSSESFRSVAQINQPISPFKLK